MQDHLRLHFANQAASDEAVLADLPTPLRRRVLRFLYLEQLTRTSLFRRARTPCLPASMLRCMLWRQQLTSVCQLFKAERACCGSCTWGSSRAPPQACSLRPGAHALLASMLRCAALHAVSEQTALLPMSAQGRTCVRAGTPGSASWMPCWAQRAWSCSCPRYAPATPGLLCRCTGRRSAAPLPGMADAQLAAVPALVCATGAGSGAVASACVQASRAAAAPRALLSPAWMHAHPQAAPLAAVTAAQRQPIG